MKKLTLLLLLITNSLNLVSQNYIPMAVDSANWAMSSNMGNGTESIVLRIEGDTIVNNLLYSKIYHYNREDITPTKQTGKLLGLIRDDINEKKVYGGLLGGIQYGFETFLNFNVQCYWNDTTSFIEHLLYDFDVQAGDSINICMLPQSAEVLEIDTINRFGYQRRTLTLDDDQQTIMTEGIGTCIGIFKGQQCFLTGSPAHFGLSNYCIGSFLECDLITSSSKEPANSIQFTVFPNPVTQELFINSSVDIENVTLIDFNGVIIRTFENTNNLDLTNCPSGLYCLKIRANNGITYSKKITKI